MDKVSNLPSIKNLPAGISMRSAGDVEIMEEMNESFSLASIIGLLLVYVVQVLLYKDWIQPFTRMASLPLSIGGAVVFLLLTRTEFSMPAIIGLLTLMGSADRP